MSSSISTAPGQREVVALVRAAQRGDEQAWNRLVSAWSPMLRRVVGRYGFAPCDIDDAVQAAWVQAFKYITNLNAPEALPGWLAAIARRVALQMLQTATREILTDEVPEYAAVDERPLEHAVIDSERTAAVHAAVARLPHRQREVVFALLVAPSSSYRCVADGLRIPIGSIGPTRARSLERLRGDMALAGAVAA